MEETQIRHLTCCCCGEATQGRQWYNRDTGFGLCEKCIPYVSRKQSPEEVLSCYGRQGYHFDVKEL
jgi:hypothetical protein